MGGVVLLFLLGAITGVLLTLLVIDMRKNNGGD